MFAFALACLLAPPGFASSPKDAAETGPPRTFELSDGRYRPISPTSLAILRDPTMRYEAADVLALLRDGQLPRLRTPHLNMLPTAGRYWAAFSLRNPTSATLSRVVDLRRPHLLALDVWIASEGEEPRAVVRLPPNAALSERAIQRRYHAFPIELEPDERATLVIGYRSFANGWLAPHISSPESMVRALAFEDALNWFVNGALIAMMAFALVMIPVIGWRLSLAFVAFAAFAFLFVAHEEGYLLALAADMRIVADRVGLLIGLSMTLAALVLARLLFRTRETQQRADRVYRAIVVALAATTAALPWAYGHSAYHAFGYAIIVLTSLAHPVIGLMALRQGQAGAKPFLLGSPFVVGSLIYSALAHLWPGRFSIEATLDFGQLTLLAEAIAFALAIQVRVLNLRREHDAIAHRAMQEANARLLLLRALDDSERRYEETDAAARRAHGRLATLGHDIRQPLLSLRTTLDRLGDVPDSEHRRMRDAFAFMESLARQADGSVAENRPASELEPFDIGIVLGNAAGMFTEEAAENGITLEHEGEGFQVVARPIQLMRIVNNLIANAVRHSGGRHVRVSATADARTCHIEVADDGRGLDPDALATAQLDGVKRSGSQGDGLGLAIVRELAQRERLGFEMTSRPGRGTTARLTLPLATIQQGFGVRDEAVPQARAV